MAQLARGGRLVVPVGGGAIQSLRVIRRDDDGKLSITDRGGVVFVPLVGERGFARRRDSRRYGCAPAPISHSRDLQRLLDPRQVALLVGVVGADDLLDVVGEVERQVVRVGLVEHLLVRLHRLQRQLGAAEAGHLRHRLAHDALDVRDRSTGLPPRREHDQRQILHVALVIAAEADQRLAHRDLLDVVDRAVVRADGVEVETDELVELLDLLVDGERHGRPPGLRCRLVMGR